MSENSEPIQPSGRKKKISEWVSFLAFKAPAIRIALELSSCFVLFELGVRLLGRQATSIDDPTLLFLWLGICSAVAVLDRMIFFKPLCRFEAAIKLSNSGLVESALSELDQLSPTSEGWVKIPRDLYYLERSRIQLNNSRFIEATLELIKARQNGALEESCFSLELEILRAQGEFKSAAERIQSSPELSPERTFELAVTRFEEGYSHSGYGVDRASLREAYSLFADVAKKASNLQALTDAYSESCSLWLGKAEEAFPKLLKQLRTLPIEPLQLGSNLNSHVGRLYLSRSYYALTHGEKLLGASDNRLGSALLPRAQLTALRKKIGEELIDENSTQASPTNLSTTPARDR